MTQLNAGSIFEGLPKLVLTISLLHVSACVLFMLAYSYGFGGNIVTLYGPNDIFSVGLRDLVFLYISCIAGPLLAKIIRLSGKGAYASDRIEAIEDPSARAAAAANLKEMQKVGKYIAYVLIAFCLAGAVYTKIVDNPIFYFTLAWPILILVPLHQEKIKRIFNIDYRVFEAFDLVIILFASSLAAGACIGAIERSSKYDNFREKTIFCGDFAIIRSISDKFIGVDRANRKYVIDADCKIIFSFTGKQRVQRGL